jgi:hypothetical protein
MKPEIFFKSNGEIFISKELSNDWMIKIPTNAHGLRKSGTCSLKMVDYRYTLKEKLGIVYIDTALKSYVKIPLHILNECPPEAKTFQGMKNSLYVFHIKQIIEGYKLQLIKISHGDIPKKEETGLAAEIRRKYGL